MAYGNLASMTMENKCQDKQEKARRLRAKIDGKAWSLAFTVNTALSRLKKSNEMQQYADIYLLLNYSTCFGCQSRQSLGVHKTVVADSGTDRTIWGASFFKRMFE